MPPFVHNMYYIHYRTVHYIVYAVRKLCVIEHSPELTLCHQFLRDLVEPIHLPARMMD